jgi:hypothetical protein
MPKKFNFFKDVYDPLATRLKPVTKALIPALTNKAVEKVQSFSKGGRVRGGKTGKPVMVKAHVGEHVLTKKQRESMLKALGAK